MTKNLERHQRKGNSDRVNRRHKGWTPERRARQAGFIRRWQPWRRSTGPRTEAGKARCAMNALTHGFRSRANIHRLRRVRHALRLAAYNIERLNAFIRSSARPPIRTKPAYAKLLLASARRRTCPPNPGLRSGGRRMI